LKVKFECIECIIRRLAKEISMATDNERLRFEAFKSILKEIFENFMPNTNPANLGTLKDKLIKKNTGVEDYYKELKKSANKTALNLVNKLRLKMNKIPEDYERFRFAVLSAIAGNSMEFFVLGNDFEINKIDIIQANTEKELVIDNIRDLYNQIKKGYKILYLVDNAGEIAFDTLLTEQMMNLGAEVIVAVKSKPIMNDATMIDANYVNMHKYANKVIATGSNSIGLIIKDCSKELLNYIDQSDLIVSKGMGYYETLGDLKINKPIMILLRSKCLPVAKDLGIPQNRNVAKLIRSTSELS
jgi:uncharacterized protein with ATP-grasp and redox domains